MREFRQVRGMNDELAKLIAKYRRSPEFLLVELNDVNQKGMTGDTLLHAAVVAGSLEDVDLLLRSGALVNAIGDLGSTPLHYAASRGLSEIIRKLLQSGADRNIRNEFGQTAADLASLMKRREASKMLREHKHG